ncbi:hypothetical protein GF361_03085, partial [Candidatus Woesearchaeota archaeon]|nr:hypothetical protein [Candidatus Woesearchaeota archaeon]
SEHEVTRDTCEEGCVDGSCISDDGCVVPFDGMNITENTVFCKGSYELLNGIKIAVDNIKLDCNGSILKGAGIGNGIEIIGYSDVEIKNCYVDEFSKGIYAKDVINAEIIDNKLTSQLYIKGVDSVVDGNEIDYSRLYAQGDNITISNNIVDNYSDHLIRLYRLYNSRVTGNYIPDYAYWGRGISMDGVGNTVIENNSITEKSNRGGYAIYCWYRCEDLIIKGNDLGGSEYGIEGDSIFNYRNSYIYLNKFKDFTSVKDVSNESNLLYHSQEGNRWLDYDEESEGCIDADVDGICDDPYDAGEGLIDEYPLAKPFECSFNSDCWKENGWAGDEYCENGDIWQSYRRYKCYNPGTHESYCGYEEEEKEKRECDHGCSDGVCLSKEFTCSSDNDCGSDGYVGSSYCSEDDVYQVHRQWSCHNPGTSEAYCSYDDENELIESCSYDCVNGDCIASGCSVDSDCGEEKWIGSSYCNGADIYQIYGSWNCNNGTCEYSENEVLKENCGACLNGVCVDEYGESNKTVDLSVSGFVVQYPDNPKAGETTIFAFALRNTGESAVKAEWEIDTGEGIIKGVHSLDAGDARVIARRLTYSAAGVYNTKVTADPDGKIDESNEANNQEEISLVVEG